MTVPRLGLTVDLPRSNFPEGEQDSVRSIDSSLSDLEGYCEDLRAALILFNVAAHQSDAARAQRDNESTSVWTRCTRIACRDGAMTIYHIGKTMDGIRDSFKNAPTFRQVVNHKHLRSAAKQLATDFPLYIKIRHAIGHKSELTNTPERIAENAFSGDIDIPGFISITGAHECIISESLNGSTFYTTFEGEIISYDLSLETLEKIHFTVKKFMSGFQPYVVPHPVWKQ